jgi:hypothetical protein
MKNYLGFKVCDFTRHARHGGMEKRTCWHVLAWLLAECAAIWGFMPACQHASRFLNLLVIGGGYTEELLYIPPLKEVFHGSSDGCA